MACQCASCSSEGLLPQTDRCLYYRVTNDDFRRTFETFEGETGE